MLYMPDCFPKPWLISKRAKVEIVTRKPYFICQNYKIVIQIITTWSSWRWRAASIPVRHFHWENIFTKKILRSLAFRISVYSWVIIQSLSDWISRGCFDFKPDFPHVCFAHSNRQCLQNLHSKFQNNLNSVSQTGRNSIYDMSLTAVLGSFSCQVAERLAKTLSMGRLLKLAHDWKECRLKLRSCV